MSPSDRLRIAGEAAEVLEEHGYVSVARLADGVVTLECWERSQTGGRMHRHVVDEEGATTRLLADTCLLALRAGPASDLTSN
jgi:hypothetical protein